MNQQTRTKLKRLFNEQDRYEKLKGVFDHARTGQPILFKTSPGNQIQVTDTELAKFILPFIIGKLDGIEDQLRKEKV